MNTQAAIEQLTNRQVKSIEEWASVYFVRFVSGRPTFVSKKVLNKQPAPFTYTMKADRSRRKPWAAKITGLSNDEYKLSRQWLVPTNVEWNRKGCESATFEITEQGIYQDQSSGYFQVYLEDGEFTYREMCLAEAIHIFETAATAQPRATAHPAAVGLF